MAGLEAYVLRNQETGSEISFALETGKVPLKRVSFFNQDGKQLTHVVEALDVEFKDISGDDIQLPDLPVRFEIAEQRAESIKQGGHKEQGDRLEQSIKNLKLNNKPRK